MAPSGVPGIERAAASGLEAATCQRVHTHIRHFVSLDDWRKHWLNGFLDGQCRGVLPRHEDNVFNLGERQSPSIDDIVPLIRGALLLRHLSLRR